VKQGVQRIHQGEFMDYAKGLTLARTHAGVSKRRLAALAGLDASYVAHIEAGRRKPSLDAMESIAGALGITVPVLMLLSAENKELRGTNPEMATVLGERLMAVLKEVMS
jgi:transcriptional regulator with XRE-family HTH domain